MADSQPLNLWDRRFNKSEDILVVPDRVDSSLERLFAGPTKAVGRLHDRYTVVTSDKAVTKEVNCEGQGGVEHSQDDINRGRFASVRSRYSGSGFTNYDCDSGLRHAMGQDNVLRIEGKTKS